MAELDLNLNRQVRDYTCFQVSVILMSQFIVLRKKANILFFHQHFILSCLNSRPHMNILSCRIGRARANPTVLKCYSPNVSLPKNGIDYSCILLP